MAEPKAADHKPFILQERVAGTSLSTLAYALDLSEPDTLDLLVEALSAVGESLLDPQQARTLELLRLDRFTAKLNERIEAGDIEAIKLATQISLRRSKLLGIEKTVQDQVKSQVEGYLDRILSAARSTLGDAQYRQLRMALMRTGPAARNIKDVS